MKVANFLVLAVLFLFTFQVRSQTVTPITELLDRLKTNHMGSISEVFSPAELEQLQQYLSQNSMLPNNESDLLTRRHSSTKGNTPVSVVTINPIDITTEIHGLSPLSAFEGAGVVGVSPNQDAYIIDNDNRLHIRGVQSTTYTDRGVISNITPGQSITGAEITSDGNIYMLGTNGVDNSSLYMLDPDQVAAIPIGGNNGLIIPINLIRDGSDNLFTIDVDDDNTYGINKTTGVVNFIGSAGYDANFGQGASYDPAADALLLAAFNAGIGDTELRSLNPLTGQTSSLGVITPGTVDQYGWMGYFDADLLNDIDFNSNGFSIYPNPTRSKLSIIAQDTIKEVMIYNSLGQLVMHSVLNSTSGVFELDHLNDGLYTLHVRTDNKTSTGKLVKY